MRVAVAEIPMEVRAEAAWQLVVDGVHPLDALYVAVWPQSKAFVASDERIERYCRNGHAMTRENTYVVPSRGWRRCLTCKNQTDRRARRETKQPCVFCGEPATPSYNKRGSGKDIVRCRKCWLKSIDVATYAGDKVG